MVEQPLHDRLAIVESALDGERVDVGGARCRHHPPLHIRDAAMRKQHDQIDIVEAGERIDRRTSGIAGGRDHDGGALRALGQHMIHQPRDQLHRHVLERQRRAVKQLQHELIGTDLVERHHGGMTESGIGLVGHAAEIGIGDFTADKRPDHIDRDFPIGPAEKSGDGARPKAAARLQARRGRRRGQARSASHRRSRASGPHPGSKYIASSRPPKAQGPPKPLISHGFITSHGVKSRGTIERFGVKWKPSIEGFGRLLRYWARFQQPSLRAKRSNPAFFSSHEESWIASSLSLLAMTAGRYESAISRT